MVAISKRKLTPVCTNLAAVHCGANVVKFANEDDSEENKTLDVLI